SGVCAGLLHWPRAAFVGAWLVVGAAVVGWFLVANGIDPLVQLRRRWKGGVVAGAIAGAGLALTVLRQPAPPHPAGGSALAGDVLWLGLVYGVVDALVLSVLPVLALYGMRSAAALAEPGGRLRAAGAALAGSLVVTAAYHLGFPEFRGGALAAPLIGNTVMTVAYLVAGNPLAPVVAHVLMHVAAVLHGAGAAGQLPPHS
ncbi:MAG TPA: hypothetical protein VFQ38_07745, partial [Longimicrobiales bacterium]|nr:hypothetical protein [Longimicrobiales bacterium]